MKLSVLYNKHQTSLFILHTCLISRPNGLLIFNSKFTSAKEQTQMTHCLQEGAGWAGLSLRDSSHLPTFHSSAAFVLQQAAAVTHGGSFTLVRFPHHHKQTRSCWRKEKQEERVKVQPLGAIWPTFCSNMFGPHLPQVNGSYRKHDYPRSLKTTDNHGLKTAAFWIQYIKLCVTHYSTALVNVRRRMLHPASFPHRKSPEMHQRVSPY